MLAATGEPVAYRPDTVGFTSAVLWDNFRVNHYVIKSWREYWFKKKSRGRMSLAGGQHHRMYFASHDRNDEIDTAAANRVPELAQYYGALVDIVQKAGLSYLPSAMIGSGITALPPDVILGYLGPFEIRDNILYGRGWAL